MALASGDDPAEAIPLLEDAVGRQPDNGVAHLTLAAALFDARRDIDRITAHARHAVRLLPSDPGALVMLGRALAVRGQFQEAAVLVDRALDVSPGDADAHELRRLIGISVARRPSGTAELP
jgi:cytochrome c-type biogenesis protein CcmH/NrfG